MHVANRSHPKLATSIARVLTGCSTAVLSVNRTSVRGALSLNVLYGARRRRSKFVVGRLLFGTSSLKIAIHFCPVAAGRCRS